MPLYGLGNAVGAVGAEGDFGAVDGFQAPPVCTVQPVVSGSAALGSTLTTTDGTFVGTGLGAVSRQWYRGTNTPIAGQTASTYVTAAADYGLGVYCVVSRANAVGSASGTSNAITVTATAPVNTVAPAISGTTAYGSTLTSTTGTWTGTATITYAYQWKLGSTNVGANQNTYVTVIGDNAGSITCVVTASNVVGSTPATSNAIVVAGPPVNSVAPVISGTTTSGSTLTATTGTWTGGTTITFAYQWKSGVTNVGSNQNTYVTQVSDVGASITCVVTGTNNAGNASGTSNGITVTAAVSTWDTTVTNSGHTTYSNSNLTASFDGSSGTTHFTKGTQAKTSTKLYFELIPTGFFHLCAGMVRNDVPVDNNGMSIFNGTDTGAGANGYEIGITPDSIHRGLDGNTGSGAAWNTNGDNMGCVADLDVGTLKIYRNNVSTHAAWNLPGWVAGQAWTPACGSADGSAGSCILATAAANQTYPGRAATDGAVAWDS